MLSSTQDRICALRAKFQDYHIQGFIIPTADPHLSEYTAPHWKFRKWVTGFTGSAGTAVILTDKAGLWTDSRYFIQASDQLKGTGITLMKEKLPDTPTIEKYLSENHITAIGIDSTLFSHSQVESWKSKSSIAFIDCPHLIDEVWDARPAMPDSKAYLYDGGKSSEDKIAAIRKRLQEEGVDGLMISALDEIAWVLNIRGNDVHDNPVLVSFLLITQDKVRFFISQDKLTDEVRLYLSSLHIEVLPYEEAYQQQKDLEHQCILTDKNKMNDALYNTIPLRKEGVSPIPLMKAVRNAQEIKGIHAAMQRDGIAMVRFIKWLKENVATEKETELSVDKKLNEFRAAQPLFMGESFDTIAGYGVHAAIVHYSATPETDVIIKPKGFLLLDSGAQYLDGTTDITRTIALGALTDDEKKDYTLILKGHIDLAMSVFPAGTTGGQLDAFARMPIWKEHKNFLHGTGHGVGHFLSVHEGPQSIRMEQNNTPLLPGMVTSNEPGIYIENKHGIRIENLVLTVDDGEGMFGEYYRFETLTLCPISKEPIVKEMLTDEEIRWFNAYHEKVYRLLAPDLNEEERSWLQQATSAI
jgi:Xaa-Pro aminopeptidase